MVRRVSCQVPLKRPRIPVTLPLPSGRMSEAKLAYELVRTIRVFPWLSTMFSSP